MATPPRRLRDQTWPWSLLAAAGFAVGLLAQRGGPWGWWRRGRRPASTSPAAADATGTPALVAGAIVATSVVPSPHETEGPPVLPEGGGSVGGAGASANLE
jgi:hypothetical protein